MEQYQEAILDYGSAPIEPSDIYAIRRKSDSFYGLGQNQEAVPWIDRLYNTAIRVLVALANK
ncbi:MAG TPA: hypothetical protein VH500_24090 [Nitrososphaeraceae archaeon]